MTLRKLSERLVKRLMKTLSLFLKDGKLMAAFLPEKPELNHEMPSHVVDDIISAYETLHSEALSQAMEVVNSKDVPFDVFPVTAKEGEFYKWEGSYELICKGRLDPLSLKLLPINVKEPVLTFCLQDEFYRDLLNDDPQIQSETKEAFAIRFAEWVGKEDYTFSVIQEKWRKFSHDSGLTTSELMEEFKKEKIWESQS